MVVAAVVSCLGDDDDVGRNVRRIGSGGLIKKGVLSKKGRICWSKETGLQTNHRCGCQPKNVREGNHNAGIVF